MFRKRREEEKRLAAQLRAEADCALPTPLESRRSRLCAAIMQARPGSDELCPVPSPMRCFPRYVPTAIAAACLAGMLALGWSWRSGGPDSQTSAPAGSSTTDFAPLARLSDVAFQRIGAALASGDASTRWAGLDHDGRLVLHLLTERFPFRIAAEAASPGTVESTSCY